MQAATCRVDRPVGWRQGAVGTYDAAVVTADLDGKVHVDKDEMATRAP